MSESEFEESIERMLQGQSAAKDIERLKQIAADPMGAETIVEQRTVDHLLRLLAEEESEQEKFVTGCFDRFNEQFSIRTKVQLPEPVPKKQIHLAALLSVAASFIALGFVAWWITNGVSPKEIPREQQVSVNESHHLESEDSNSAIVVGNDNQVEVDEIVEPIETPATVSELAVESSVKTDGVMDAGPDLSIDEADRIAQSPPVNDVASGHADLAPLEVEPVPVLGRIIASRTSSWSEDSPANLQVGRFELEEGSARLKFSNGALLRLAAPAKLEITDERTVRMLYGDVLFDIPRKVDRFRCLVGDFTMDQIDNASFYVRVKPDDQWESFLTRGKYNLEHGDRPEACLRLSKGELDQVAVAKVNSDRGMPETLIARGKKSFLGQCFEGDRCVEVDSPAKLKDFLGNVVNNEKVGWDRFARGYESFNAQMLNLEEIPNEMQFREFLLRHLNQSFPESFRFPGDGKGVGTTQFRGSLNINGEERHFDSLEEFNRAKAQMMGSEGTLLPQPLRSETSFNIGGQRLEFSTADMFRQLRRKMNK